MKNLKLMALVVLVCYGQSMLAMTERERLSQTEQAFDARLQADITKSRREAILDIQRANEQLEKASDLLEQERAEAKLDKALEKLFRNRKRTRKQ